MTEAPTPCRICRNPLDPFPMGEKNGYNFFACKTCGSVMAEPWPTQEVIDKYFGDIQPEMVHAQSPKKEIAEATRNLRKVVGNRKGLRMLDVCTRQGYAVEAAKELGLQPHGLDSHNFCIAFAKDKYDPHLFEHATVQDYAARGGQADVIYVLEGFCEQPDLESFTAALAKILAPGGKIYIHEPDGNHLRLPANFTGWVFVDPPMNFCYLSKKGMEVLLGRHGLKVQKKFLSWSPFMRLIVTHK